MKGVWFDSSASSYLHLWGFMRADLSTSRVYFGEFATGSAYIGTDFDLNDILYLNFDVEI
jgi:hypothetical protein